MQPKFDASKPVQTRAGQPARLLVTDRKDPTFPVLALVTINGQEVPHSYTAEGNFFANEYDNGMDLVNVPVKRTTYINVYPPNYNGGSSTYTASETAAAADLKADKRNRLARVRVDYIEGQFDE